MPHIIRVEENFWGYNNCEHLKLLIDGLSIHRRDRGLNFHEYGWLPNGKFGVINYHWEWWVDFREDSRGVVPANAELVNPYSKVFGWLSFKTALEAYRYLKGE